MLDKMRGGATGPNTVYDPVCGMTIDPSKAAGTSQYEGKTVYFCSGGCKKRFDADPASFAAKIR
jgi:Cu+-exporting ATPase